MCINYSQLILSKLRQKVNEALALARRNPLRTVTLGLLMVAIWGLSPFNPFNPFNQGIQTLMATLGDFLAVARLLAQHLISWRQSHPVLAHSIFMSALVFCSATDVPSPAVVIVAGGAVFGVASTVLMALPAVALGSLIPFSLARRLLEPWLIERFNERVQIFRAGFSRGGITYLATLRLMPMMPFVAVNLFMGLTDMPAQTFFLATAIFRLPMTLLQAQAGTHLATLQNWTDVISKQSMILLILMALTPLLSRRLMQSRL